MLKRNATQAEAHAPSTQGASMARERPKWRAPETKPRWTRPESSATSQGTSKKGATCTESGQTNEVHIEHAVAGPEPMWLGSAPEAEPYAQQQHEHEPSASEAERPESERHSPEHAVPALCVARVELFTEQFHGARLASASMARVGPWYWLLPPRFESPLRFYILVCIKSSSKRALSPRAT